MIEEKRERDSQRSKVYKAEEVLNSYSKIKFQTTKEIERYVASILKTKWSQKRWGIKTRVIVKDGRGRRKAGGRPIHNGVFLTMPIWSRKEWIVLHELAHCLASKGAWHNWEFCSVYLQLVGFKLGKEAAKALKSSFRKERVRVRPKPKRNMSEDQRQKLRERIAMVRSMRKSNQVAGS